MARSKAITPVQVNTVLENTRALIDALDDDDAAYVTAQGAEIGVLTSSVEKLRQRAARLQKKVSESPDMVKLKALKAKIKEVDTSRSEVVSRVTGVIEKAASGKKGKQIRAALTDGSDA